jgi:hypothetical protein
VPVSVVPTIAIIKFWTSFFCHIKKMIYSKSSFIGIVTSVKFVYNLSICHAFRISKKSALYLLLKAVCRTGKSQKSWVYQKVRYTYYVIKKWFEEDTVGRRPGSGRRRITSAQDDEGIIDIIQNRPFTTAIVEVNQTNFPASVVTARRRLKGAGLRNHSAVQKPILTPLHKELRLGFSWKHLESLLKSSNFF